MIKSGSLPCHYNDILPGSLLKYKYDRITHRLFISRDVSIWISMPSRHVEIYGSNFALTENWQKI